MAIFLGYAFFSFQGFFYVQKNEKGEKYEFEFSDTKFKYRHKKNTR